MIAANKFPFTTIKLPVAEEELKLHFERLYTTSEKLNIPFTYSYEQFNEEVELSKNDSNVLKIINENNQLKIITRDYQSTGIEYVSLKSKFVSCTWQDLKLDPNHEQKQLLTEAKANGYDDYLLIDTDSLILETTIANIFIVKNKQIYTPKLNGKVLKGTIRTRLVNKYQINESDIFLEDLQNIDGIFISNAVKKLAIVKSVDNVEFNDEYTENLVNIFKKYLEE